MDTRQPHHTHAARPQPHLRHVQTAVHEALAECQQQGKAQPYHVLKERAVTLWEQKFSQKLTQWGVLHTLPLREPANSRKLPPFAKRMLEESLLAFDQDTWSQALLLTHDSKVLFVVQTVQQALQQLPGMTFYELTDCVIQHITAYCSNTGDVEPGQPVYLHFSKLEPRDVPAPDPAPDASSEWTTVQPRRQRRPPRPTTVETLELAFPALGWYYAYKIFAFPHWMHLNRSNFHEASQWRNLSNSERHHNRILDHVRSVTRIQAELFQLHMQDASEKVDYSKPLEWGSHTQDDAAE